MTFQRQLASLSLGWWMIAAADSNASAQTSSLHSAASRGYRIREYRWDAVLGQRWAIFEDAAHPEWPLLSELAQQSSTSPSGVPGLLDTGVTPEIKIPVKVVRVGDLVTLWSEDRNVRLNLAAIAEGNAAIGDRIQLRVTGAGASGSAGWRAAGIVRGPGSVEMEQ